MPGRPESPEIRITRMYDAPVRVVWDAWTDPAQVAQWWGPRGFTLTTHSKDLRKGGHWHYTMHGPDGVDYPNRTHYFEVEECSKLVYDHGASDDRPPLFRVTVVFSEIGGKTKMEMCMTLPTPEAAAQTRKFIRKAGGEATWDRLAEFVAEGTGGKPVFVINRSFDAPLDLMFEMWTTPKHFLQWLPPPGFEMQFLRSDIRPGGSTFFFMTGPENLKVFARADYQEVARPDRVVYTQQFCDENEKISRHPLAPAWPDTMLMTVQLNPEGDDQTRVTVTCEPHGAIPREELDAFIESRTGMTQGWSGSFDKLESVLAGGNCR